MILGANAKVKIEHFSESDGLPQSNVTCVIQDSKGLIWISSWNGLSRYNGYEFKNFKAKQGDNCPLTSNRILKIRETKNADIICKCENGYYLFKRKEKRFAALNNMKSDFGDRYRPSESTLRTIGELPDFKNTEFNVLYRDRQQGFWVYSHSGLYRVSFTKEPMKPVKIAPEGEEFIRTIYLDRKGRTFIADKNGFVRISSTSGTHIGYLKADGGVSKQRTPFGCNVYSMFEDSKGWLWIGTKPNGLFRLKPTKNGGFTAKNFSRNGTRGHTVNCNSIYSITEDHKGRILLGTYGGGLNIIENPHDDNPTFRSCSSGNTQLQKDALFIHDLQLTGSGTLLVGTNGGLYSCDINKTDGKMLFYGNRRRPADASSISNNQVMDILQTKDGRILVATYGGGLNIITSGNLLSDKIKFKALTTDNGMCSDVCLSLCQDNKGIVWIVSEHSLMMFDLKRQSFTNFTETMFTHGFSFSEVVPLCINGNILFGTTQGLLTVKGDDCQKSGFTPRIIIDSPDTIMLSPEERNISLEIAALDFNKNEAIQYAYMLEGVDKEWMFTRDNHINLQNFPAGTFRLRVRSTNGDGVWVNNDTFITIHRTPYFNERPVAWMLYGGLSLLLLFVILKVAKYIRLLEKEVKSLRLSKEETMEYIRVKVGDMMDSETSKETEKNNGSIETNKFRKQVEDYICSHMADAEFNVADFASEMNMSRSQLYIQMKKEFGCTPNNYITEKRIDHAYKLLKENPELNISEIAYRCGFSDPKYFSRCFKKNIGRTPSEIREHNNA